MRNLDPRRARWIRVRMVMLACVMALGLGRLVARAHELQVAPSETHNRALSLAEEQYDRDQSLQPRRGTVYDRHHHALAVSVDTPSLSANPRQLQRRVSNLSTFSARLGAALHMPAADVEAQLSQNRAFRWVKHYLTAAEVESVRGVLREFNLREGQGLDLTEEPRRWYPNRELAANVLGFVGPDGSGVEGLEHSLNEHLQGRRLELRGIRDAMGRLVFAEGLTPADGSSGHDVTLTIDKTIQFITERELALTVREFEAVGGTVVVTEPHTGEVLALASYPTFDPNHYNQYDNDSRRNRAIMDRFEPGSTMKIFSVGGGLDAGVVSPGQQINTFNGEWQVADQRVRDTHPAAFMTPMEILQRSSNIGAAQIGLALGAEGLERVYRRFGFGERTGLPLPGEARCRFGERRWYEPEVATVSFGQGINVTAVQMAQALGAVANGGRLVPLLLVTRVTDATGALLEEHGPETGRPALSPRVAALLGDMLTSVTEQGGTGEAAAIDGVRVAGKTGTAQKARLHGRGYDDQRWMASFIGYAPVERPAVVVTVFIDEPRIAHQGGAVAAPLFHRVMEQTLRYLGRLPPGPRTTPPPTPPARDTRSNTEALPEPEAAPSAAAPSADGGVAPSGATVPALRGQTARRAVQTLGAQGLEPVLVGTGIVVRQSPAAGAPVPADHRVVLELEPGGGAPRPQVLTAGTPAVPADVSPASEVAP